MIISAFVSIQMKGVARSLSLALAPCNLNASRGVSGLYSRELPFAVVHIFFVRNYFVSVPSKVYTRMYMLRLSRRANEN